MTRMPLFFVAALAVTTAQADGVLVDKSEIRFVSKQMGVDVEGRFRKWAADVVWQPNDVAKSKAIIDIDLASIDLASEDSENEVRGAVWFDTKKFPIAHFASTSIKDGGGGKFDVAGELSIKGVTKPIVVPVMLKKDAAGGSVAEGSFVVKRLDYKIGEGAWSDPDTVANEVTVRIRMALAPTK